LPTTLVVNTRVHIVVVVVSSIRQDPSDETLYELQQQRKTGSLADSIECNPELTSILNNLQIIGSHLSGY